MGALRTTAGQSLRRSIDQRRRLECVRRLKRRRRPSRPTALVERAVADKYQRHGLPCLNFFADAHRDLDTGAMVDFLADPAPACTDLDSTSPERLAVDRRHDPAARGCDLDGTSRLSQRLRIRVASVGATSSPPTHAVRRRRPGRAQARRAREHGLDRAVRGPLQPSEESRQRGRASLRRTESRSPAAPHTLCRGPVQVARPYR